MIGDASLATLVRPPSTGGRDEPFPITVRAFGPGGAALAQGLIDHARAWQEVGRPATAGLRIDAYQPGTPRDTASTIIDKANTRLALRWA